MSVLVKNVKMPSECRECSLWAYRQGAGTTWCVPTKTLLAENHMPIQFDGRPEWCPLVELPEKHGDLIDRDVVKNAVYNQLCIKGEENLLPAEKAVFGQIVKAEAVIEAEGYR